MKYILILWVCSFLGGQTCMPPIESPIIYDSWYECSRAAHKESLLLMTRMGYKYINDNKVAMKYRCKEVTTI
jgi:hypothetical protein